MRSAFKEQKSPANVFQARAPRGYRMSDITKSGNPTVGYVKVSERLENTDRVAYEIIAKERAATEAKTARLRAMRLARDQANANESTSERII